MENHKYEEVYPYRLLETIKNGKTVYLLDKAEHTVCERDFKQNKGGKQ